MAVTGTNNRPSVLGLMAAAILLAVGAVVITLALSSYDESYEGYEVPTQLDERVATATRDGAAYQVPTDLSVECMPAEDVTDAVKMKVTAATKAAPVQCTEHLDIWHWSALWGGLAVFVGVGAAVGLLFVAFNKNARDNWWAIPLGVVFGVMVMMPFVVDFKVEMEIFFGGVIAAVVASVLLGFVYWLMTLSLKKEIYNAKRRP